VDKEKENKAMLDEFVNSVFKVARMSLRQSAATLERRFSGTLPAQAANITAAGVSAMLSPQKALSAVVESRNKVVVYSLVRGIRAVLGIPSAPPQPFPFDQYLAKAVSLPSFSRLFAMEGLGRIYTKVHLDRGADLDEAFSDQLFERMQPSFLLIFHAGMGLAFAKELWDALPADSSRGRIMDQTERILDLCRRHGLDGYSRASFEALGLVAQVFHEPKLEVVHELLERYHPEMLDTFWHGVGRGLYFAPLQMVPFSCWEAVKKAMNYGPQGSSVRDNVVSGVSSAIGMVNITSPKLVYQLLVAPYSQQLRKEPGFAHGIASSLIMREISTPDDNHHQLFSTFQPSGAAGAIEEWNATVGRLNQMALKHYAPLLKQSARYDDICSYNKDIFGWVSKVGAG
jgi:hypothetical protein